MSHQENVPERKKRAPNFSPKEKYLLLHLIDEFKRVIENKKLDSTTLREKDRAWEDITEIFNTQNPDGVSRTKESLRKFYDNMKKNLRKHIADERIKLKTMGEISSPKKEDSFINLCLSIMNGLDNPYDGDADISEDISHETVIIVKQEAGIDSEQNNVIDTENLPGVDCYLGDDVSDPSPTETTDAPPPPKEKLQPHASKIATGQLRQGRSKTLQPTWWRRRRICGKTPLKLEENHSSLVKSEMELLDMEKQMMKRRNEREEELFELQKKNMLLEIKINEVRLKKMIRNELDGDT